MGIGPLATVTVAKARTKAGEARALAADGADPIESRKAQRDEAAKAVTFQDCAAAYIEAHKASWRNAKHADQWAAILKTCADPPRLSFACLIRSGRRKPRRLPACAAASRHLELGKGARLPERRRWRGHLDDALPKRSKADRPR